jgi:hypothetical protein
MTKNIFLLLFILIYFTVLEAQVSLPLTLNAASALRMTVANNADGSITLTTTGADPFISTNVIPTYDFNTTYYISFDYVSTGGLDNLSIFYGSPPIATRSLSFGEIPAATSSRSVIVNMKRSPNWNAFFDRMRFDFGTVAGQSITIKNLRIRQPTQSEFDSDPFFIRQVEEKNLNAYLNATHSAKVNNIKVIPNKVRVNLTIPNNPGNLYLCELRMYDKVFKPESIVFSTPLSNDINIQTELDRFVNIENVRYDRIYSRWVIAEKTGDTYVYKSYARYADDVREVAPIYYAEVKPLSKKGIGGFGGAQAVKDVVDLGLHNVTINITYASILSLTPTTMSYIFNGQTYYFNPARVAEYDLTIKGATTNNAIVSAIILIPINGPPALKELLIHPDANGGFYSMANVTTLAGVNAYAAVTAFLASRYTRRDNLNGRITNWIIHNEVDAGTVWTNAGDKAMNVYTELYDRSMRTVYYTVRQFNPSGKVFASLTHHWTATAKPEHYKPRDVLNTLNSLISKQGDYEWGLAYHPYPENLFKFNTWNDTKISNNLATSFLITPKNIELIDTWIRSKANLYQGLKVRSLLFSEQGIHAGSEYDQTTITNQAAGVAYMWKKFNRLPSLEGIQHHRRVDNTNEDGLFMGLWTTNKSSMLPEVQDLKKKSWNVWQSAGTPKENDSMAFALPIIGVSSWEQTFNPLVGEVMPQKVIFNLSHLGAIVNDIDIHFNGEVRKTQVTGAATFFNVASLTQTRNYRFIKDGKAVWKDLFTVVNEDQTIPVSLDPINNLTATSLNSNSIALTWQDITDFEKGFVIEYKPDNSAVFIRLDSVAANQTSYTHTGLVLNNKNQYRIYAYNDTIKTLNSAVVSGTVITNTVDLIDPSASILVYPNPSIDGHIHINLNNYNGNSITVKLIDISGKIIHQEKINTSSSVNIYSLNINTVPASGTYILDVIGEKLKQKVKVIIK